MARKAVLGGGKRDEIIRAALNLYLENGYEGTSIRMILEHVGGEVGMFYHYFASKEEVFNRSFELFMKMQGEKLSLLMLSQSTDATPRKKLELLWGGYMNAISDYTKLSGKSIHWTILSALHEITLDTMLPAFKTISLSYLPYARFFTNKVKCFCNLSLSWDYSSRRYIFLQTMY